MKGVPIVNTPQGCTTHDGLAKHRGIYQTRRVGHSGTLDPMATGVLVVFLGRATRAVELCENDEKEYVAGLKLGVITNTQDTTGEVIETRQVQVTDEGLRETLETFLGPQQQIPPMYSAVKIGGRKLYELARKGQTVERKPRNITIETLELLDRQADECHLRVRCSKGTYVRTLCHDIGEKLGCGGCMSSLRRTKAGRFGIEDALSLEEIQAAKEQGNHEGFLKPVDFLFSHLPAITVDEKGEKRCKCGTDLPMKDLPDGEYRVYSKSGEFLMLGKGEEGVLKTVKSFFEVNEG